MLAQVPAAVGGVMATTSVEVLESPSGALQQSIQALTQFKNHANGKDVHSSVRAALASITLKASNT